MISQGVVRHSDSKLTCARIAKHRYRKALLSEIGILLFPDINLIIDFHHLLLHAFQSNQAHSLSTFGNEGMGAPECANRHYDPFPADVYMLGNFIKKDYVDVSISFCPPFFLTV